MPGDQDPRDFAAELAGYPIDERVAISQKIAEREGTRAAVRAPRRLRLNITQAPLLSPGYVTCSIFQSANGVNWGCSGTQVVFDGDWFRDVFGAPAEGRRIEFEISNPHDVSD